MVVHVKFAFVALLLAIAVMPCSTRAQDYYLGELRLFPYNFAPTGWAFCEGQLLSISQNTALFSLLGTTYGGNGTTNFALPDLRGRVPVGAGQGPGLSNYQIGEQFGEEAHTLISSEMPAHSHALSVSGDIGSTDSPTNTLPARNAAGVPQYAASANSTASPGAIGIAGGTQPHENRQPGLVLHWCIALQGIFPPRP